MKRYTEEELDRMQDEADIRGREIMENEARAVAVSYNQDTRRLVLDLHNGATLILPIELMQNLRDASAEDLSEVELWSNGSALHWEKLDADFRVPELLQGVFGGKAWMRSLREHYSEITAKGGRSKTPAKQNASRENGKKGGRPKKEAA